MDLPRASGDLIFGHKQMNTGRLSAPLRARVLLSALLALVTVPSMGQTLIHTTETAASGGLIDLVGDGLSSAQVYVRKGNADGSFGAPLACAVLTGSDQLLQARVPASMDRSPYQVWVRRAASQSKALEINSPRVTFQNRDQCYPGEILMIYGHNLAGATGLPSVRFVAPDGTILNATVWTANPNGWAIVLASPKNLIPGVRYSIEISNGGAGNVIGHTRCDSAITAVPRMNDPFGLDTGIVNGFAPLMRNVYNVKTDPRLSLKAVGDGVTDDSYAIQGALDKAARDGGGIVYLPAGTYKADKPGRPGGYWSTIDVWGKTMLQGAGMGSTVLRFGMRYTPTAPPTQEHFLTLHKEGPSGLNGLTLQNLNTSPIPSNVLRKAEVRVVQSSVVLNNVDVQLNNGTPAYLTDLDHSVINNCRFTSTSTSEGPINLQGASWLQFSNNYVSHRVGRVSLHQTSNTWVVNSTFERDTSYAVPGSVESGGIETSFSSRLAIVQCDIVCVGARSQKGDVDGEQIMSQTAEIRDLRYVGNVTAATGTSITDSAAAWSDATRFADPNYPGPLRMIVAVTKGKGFGQWRFIDHVVGKTLHVADPWNVMPDATSLYTIHGLPAYQHTLLWNTIRNGTIGIEFYGGGIDNVAAENTLTNTGFIVFRAQSSWVADGASNWMNALSWYNLAEGNLLTNVDSLLPAAISVISVVPQSYGLCNASLANEVRNNTIVVGRTPIEVSGESCWLDGYVNKGVVYSGVAMPIANVGTLFSGNRSVGLSQWWYPSGGSLCAGFY